MGCDHPIATKVAIASRTHKSYSKYWPVGNLRTFNGFARKYTRVKIFELSLSYRYFYLVNKFKIAYNVILELSVVGIFTGFPIYAFVHVFLYITYENFLYTFNALIIIAAQNQSNWNHANLFIIFVYEIN